MTSDDKRIAFARNSLNLPPETAVECIPFGGRGSDRAYFRIRWDSGGSAILVHYQQNRIENCYFADIAWFLQENGIRVPQIIRCDPLAGLMLVQDLGDTDLWTLRHETWEIRERLYQKTLMAVHRLHSFPERDFPSGRVPLMEAFGPNLYRWERTYFKENFVGKYCGIELEPNAALHLETELVRLAERLERGGRSLVHRDLQSQNVMIYRDEPFLIDFQGMRFGSPFYDLGSLLCDPYVPLTEEERLKLLSFHYEYSESRLDWNEFQRLFWEASAQRLMQALGAYGFLGVVKGIESYLAHIPSGLANLQSAARHAASLPHLLELCDCCNQKSGIPPI
jgi:aminoglycoside/choline kinase family phosphotransferase